MMQPNLQDRLGKLQLERRIAPDVPAMIETDATRCLQVVGNLLQVRRGVMFGREELHAPARAVPPPDRSTLEQSRRMPVTAVDVANSSFHPSANAAECREIRRRRRIHPPHG